MLVKCFCIIYTDGDQRAKRGGHPMIMTPHILIEWAYLYILEVTIISWKPSHCYIMQREIVKHKIIIRDPSEGVILTWRIYSTVFEKRCKRRASFSFIEPWNHPNLICHILNRLYIWHKNITKLKYHKSIDVNHGWNHHSLS